MMLESVPSTESAATLASTRCKQAEQNWSQDSIIKDLTKRLADREAELRQYQREKSLLESKSPTKSSPINGSPVELQKAYESLMAHLGEREEEFRGIAQKNEHLMKRQQELEKITRELHNTMKFQRSLMHEKNSKVVELQKQLTEVNEEDDREIDKLRRQVTVALDSQRAAVTEKNELMEKLAESEKTVERMKGEIDQHVIWENETMAKATEQEMMLADKESKISKLVSKNNELRTEVENQKDLVTQETARAEQRDSMLESAQEEITLLHSKVEDLHQEILQHKQQIEIYEERFVTKGQNIVELNERVEQAEKMWAKIEEREKKFTLKESTNQLLSEENDNLRMEEKKLRSEIDELNGAFEQYKINFAEDGETVDMAYFLSKLRETVRLNSRIQQLEQLVEEKGYVMDIFQAECDLREKERVVTTGIEAVHQVLSMLKSVLNEEQVEAPRVIGKLEEALIVWSEKTGIALEMMKGDDESDDKTMKRSVITSASPDPADVAVVAQDSQDRSVDYDEDNYKDDDYTVNTDLFSAKYVDAGCVDFRHFGASEKNNQKLNEVVQSMQIGLKLIQKESVAWATDVNSYISKEIKELALSMDKSTKEDTFPANSRSTTRPIPEDTRDEYYSGSRSSASRRG